MLGSGRTEKTRKQLMNTGRLLSTIGLLLRAEREQALQSKLDGLTNALQALAGNPSGADVQQAVATSFNTLETALSNAQGEFSPAVLKRVDELGASEFFTQALTSELRDVLRENAMTPAVVQQATSRIGSRRKEFLQNLQNTQSALQTLGFGEDELEPGQAELGFQLPRQLFSNELPPLIEELRVVQRIIRPFSEIATGSAEPIEVRQISTSDPFFFFGLDPRTVLLVGGAVAWALSQWKKVEEIRKARAETAKLHGAFTDDEIKNFFDNKISASIETAIKEHAAELVPIAEAEAGRKHEQRNLVEWALKALLSRIERGMIVEIRMLPPAQDGEGADTTVFGEIEEVQERLVFPAASDKPILKLEKLANDNAPKKPTGKPPSASS
jgi:hypothetical protein